MSNFELIDDYLTNRLGEVEKEGFEKQLESDPALKADLDLQRTILQGIKGARAAQLKSMLNNVPISTGHTVEFSIARMAAGIIGAGVIGAAVYFYFQPGDVPNLKDASADFAKKGELLQTPQDQTKPVVEPENFQQEKAKSEVTAPEEKKEFNNTKGKNKEPLKNNNEEVRQPQTKVDVVDPSEEMKDTENKPGSSEVSKRSVTISHVEVETDTTNKRYTFHYQFASGKLFLYGAFDRNLYEILEINSDDHAMFLFYKENYYMLDEKQLKITQLEPITDSGLIKKLRDYRSK